MRNSSPAEASAQGNWDASARLVRNSLHNDGCSVYGDIFSSNNLW